MRYLRRLSERNQITIPPSVLSEAGISEGALFSIVAEEGRLILEPQEVTEKDLSKEDWKALDKLVLKQESAGHYTDYAGPAEAKKHFPKLRKR